MAKDTESSPLEDVDPSAQETGSAGRASLEVTADAEDRAVAAPPRRAAFPTGFLLRVVVPPLALFGALAALEYFRRRFESGRVFLPTRYPDGRWDPASEGVEYQDLYFPSEDGTLLHGWWLEHPEAVTTLIYCHGNRGSIGDRLEIFRQLLRIKANVFAFDYRGYGRSQGMPSERGLYADARSAVDLLVDRGHPLESLILLGHSLGGAVAIDTALHREVGGLVVQSSLTQLKDMARHRYPGWPMHWITSNNFRSIGKVRHLEMPKLFIHGNNDHVVPHSHGEALFRAAAEPKSFLLVPGADHHDVPQKGGLRYFRRLVRFRREVEKRRL